MAVCIAFRIESLVEENVITTMRIGRFLDFYLMYLCKFVLFLRGEINIPEEQYVMLYVRMVSKATVGRLENNGNLV